jgi:AraC-like DNA-binding protein
MPGRTLAGMDMNAHWSPVDPLGGALHFLRMSSAVYARCELTSPWGLELPSLENTLMFHVVTAGECQLSVHGVDAGFLHAGDMVLVPHGHGHTLASVDAVSATGLFDAPRAYSSERYEVIRFGGGGDRADLICGAVHYTHPATRRMIEALPPVINIAASSQLQTEWIRNSLQLMAEEAQTMRPGSEVVVARLADVLLIQAIRSWIEHSPAPRPGWLAAISDPQIGKAMRLIQNDPARDWTVAELAHEAAMSRSAFSARFRELAGEPPMQYLTRWRMHLALHGLEDGAISLGELADQVGYRSEAAFSRAFKRIVGVSPGAIRT